MLRLSFTAGALCLLLFLVTVSVATSSCVSPRAEELESVVVGELGIRFEAPRLANQSKAFREKLTLVRGANSSWLPCEILGESLMCSYGLTYFSPVPAPYFTAYFPKGKTLIEEQIEGEYDRGVGFYPASEYLLYSSKLENAQFLEIAYEYTASSSSVHALVLLGELTTDELRRAYECVPVLPKLLSPIEPSKLEALEVHTKRHLEGTSGSFALVFDPETGQLMQEAYWFWQPENPETEFRLKGENLKEALTKALAGATFPRADVRIQYTRTYGSDVPTRVLVRHEYLHRMGFLSFDAASGLWFLIDGIWVLEYGGTYMAYAAIGLVVEGVTVSKAN